MVYKEHVFTSGGKPRALTDKQEIEICVKYEDGQGAVRLGQEYSVAHSTIYGVLKRRGVTKRRPNQRPRNDFIVDGYVWTPIDWNHPIDVLMAPVNGYKYIAKHRQVMARNLNRPLRKDEQVHHIDGNRSNNELNNLQLRQGAHGSGIVAVCGDCGSNNVISTRIGQ